MKNVMIVGAARDARTRTKRAQAGARRRRVRIGGIHRVRPNRRISFTLAQCREYEEDLRKYFKDGLILFQDVDGREVPLERVFEDKSSTPSEPEPDVGPSIEPEPDVGPSIEPEPVEVMFKDEADASSTVVEPEPDTDVTDPEPLPEGYADFTKRELLALFDGRLDVPENTRNAALVDALAAWEDENFE